jgi:UDP-N-acetyl-D-glucosamine dehydrogenase
MPEYVVEKITLAMNKQKKALNGAKVLVLGIAYKRDISDVRESPALDIIRLLQEKGAQVAYNDPYVQTVKLEGDEKAHSVKLSAQMLAGYDCVVIVTDHSDYDYQWIVDNARLIVDTRNAAKNVKKGRAKIHKI